MELTHKKAFGLGLVSALTLVACSGLSIRYYGLSQVEFSRGILLGPKESDDLPFSRCAPVGNEANPCVVMFTRDFFALKQDYLDTKQKLKDCQRGN